MKLVHSLTMTILIIPSDLNLVLNLFALDKPLIKRPQALSDPLPSEDNLHHTTPEEPNNQTDQQGNIGHTATVPNSTVNIVDTTDIIGHQNGHKQDITHNVSNKVSHLRKANQSDKIDCIGRLQDSDHNTYSLRLIENAHVNANHSCTH